MKQITDKLQRQAAEWGPKIAFFAVFGFTGLAAVGLYRGYKKILSNYEPLDLSGYEDPYQD